MIGPPIRKPLVEEEKGTLGTFATELFALLPAKSLLLQKRYADPATSLVPERVTALRLAPTKPDCLIS